MSTFVSSGTVTPHASAMALADLPTSAGFGRRCAVTSTFATLSMSAVLRK